MRVVTLECRGCGTSPTFAVDFDTDNEDTKISDMQFHMDINFLANCGSCQSRAWEVTDVRKPVAVVYGARN